MTVLAPPPVAQEIVTLAGDDTRIERSCTLRLPAEPIADANGDGVVQIVADGVVLVLEGTLAGAGPETAADAYRGIGLAIRAKDVTVKGARVRGFRAGIVAREADGLVLEGCDVSGNFRQRLHSTPQREDERDWLWPHDNDANEWLEKYGAGIWIEDSRCVTVRGCRAREGQNGLVLDRVEESKVYDNDFSFLSGWGIALWRSNENVIARNACDFCVRGYSHGVYNRGQDSAGILMFEQCSENVITENSATHCGDGLFGFAGQEALGARAALSEGFEYEGRGNNENWIHGNDFSYAAAHGIEMTFSFGNFIQKNRLIGNAICGIWGGYSQFTDIAYNDIEQNGEGAYGLERGGVNIEHGRNNWIRENRFRENACGVHLWWDSDEQIAKLPWAIANGTASAENFIEDNTFEADEVAIELRESTDTLGGNNRFVRVEKGAVEVEPYMGAPTHIGLRDGYLELEGIAAQTHPVGARDELAGRDKILITEWGPYDWTSPLLFPVETSWIPHVFKRLGGVTDVEVKGDVTVLPIDPPADLELVPNRAGVTPYEIRVPGSAQAPIRGILVMTSWRIRFFAWTADPLTDEAAWRAEGEASDEHTTRALEFDFGDVGPGKFSGMKVAPDRFGTIATTELLFPPGRYRLRVASDDGVRVWVAGELALDDWSDHGVHEATHVLEVAKEATLPLRVEHYERDGAAALHVRIELAE
jgi:nitrous oxidase accessory protein NosD